MKWFKSPQNLEELKRQYKKLALENHPDLGGSDEAMKEINAEYDILFSRLKNIHENASGETYEAQAENTEPPEKFREIIESLIHLDGISIEICGSWLWITGNTYDNRNMLKKLGFRYSHNKQAWYYHGEEYTKHSKNSFTLDQIRAKYGSEKVETQKTLRLQTV